MEAMRQGGTEQSGGGDPLAALNGRVDDLSRRMENGFNRVEAKLAEQGEAIARHSEAIEGQGKAIARQDEAINDLAKEMRAGFERVHRMMVLFAGMLIVALVGLPQL